MKSLLHFFQSLFPTRASTRIRFSHADMKHREKSNRHSFIKPNPAGTKVAHKFYEGSATVAGGLQAPMAIRSVHNQKAV